MKMRVRLNFKLRYVFMLISHNVNYFFLFISALYVANKSSTE